jgi:pilus assembly protein CpaE
VIPAIAISPDARLAKEFEAALRSDGKVAIVRHVPKYPAGLELARLIRAHAPRLVLLSAAGVAEAVRVVTELEAAAPGIQVMAIDHSIDQRTLLELMRAGVREFVPLESIASELPPALDRLIAALVRKPPSIESTELMYSFLPAKPGVGCSTIALNAAVALSREPDHRALLMDFDLSCGMIGFLLQLDPTRSIVDAAERAAELDEELWPRLVQGAGSLDVLPAGPFRADFRIEPAQIRYLLDFARRNYQAICADLSGLMERYSLEVMQESKRIFLVATPELPSLHLARQKADFLRSKDLDGRLSLLLNRCQKRAIIPPEEIEKMIGIPIGMEFPNDYRGVHKALSEAKPVDSSTELGKRFRQLAQHLLAKNAEPAQRRRFVDYFAITPARYSFD